MSILIPPFLQVIEDEEFL